MRSSWTRSGGGTASSVKHCDITCTAGSSNRPCDSTPPEPQSSVVPSYVTPRTAQPTVGFRIIAFRGEEARYQCADVRIIVDDEHCAGIPTRDRRGRPRPIVVSYRLKRQTNGEAR